MTREKSFCFDKYVTYTRYWTILLGKNCSAVLSALQAVFPDYPLWHVYAYLSETFGVLKERLVIHKNDLTAAAAEWYGDLNFWGGCFESSDCLIMLHHKRFACLERYLRIVTVCGEKQWYPDSKSVERAFQKMKDALIARKSEYAEALKATIFNYHPDNKSSWEGYEIDEQGRLLPNNGKEILLANLDALGEKIGDVMLRLQSQDVRQKLLPRKSRSLSPDGYRERDLIMIGRRKRR